MRDQPVDIEATSTLRLGGGDSEGAASLGLVLLYAPRTDGVPAAVAVREGGLVVGREPPPGGLRLPFTSVSRVHAVVGMKEGELVVEDRASRNGTFVNGRRVSAAVVEPGDELRFGEAMAKLVEADVDGYARFPLEGLTPPPHSGLLGGFVMGAVRDQVARAAAGTQPLLVLGETGTGKELAAGAFHRATGRSGNLCAVNCAAIPAPLLESELFGHARGAFTGASESRLGLVRSAHGGTLFLDEIGDMPLDAQAKLLRLLETREVTPVGSHKSERVDFRLVCATHRDLPSMVARDTFRADLYARIAGHVLELPPLRERKEDIFQLTRVFLAEAGGAEREVRPGFMLALISHDWPFNVRELRAALHRAVAQTNGPLDIHHLPPDIQAGFREPGRAREVPRARDEKGHDEAPSAEQLRDMLTRHGGNVAAVARELDKDRTQIRRWMKRHAISADEFRS